MWTQGEDVVEAAVEGPRCKAWLGARHGRGRGPATESAGGLSEVASPGTGDRLGFSEEGAFRMTPIFDWVDVGWGTKELLAEGGRFHLCVMSGVHVVGCPLVSSAGQQCQMEVEIWGQCVVGRHCPGHG